MKTFTYVEDYIEVIGGWRDPDTGKTISGHNLLWFSFTPIISLARYDVSVLEHMCETVMNNKPLTTKQGDLAVRIILKYARQLAQRGVDVSPVNDLQWRAPLRVMDYGKRMSIQDDLIMIEFPFSTELIDGLREFRKDSQGKGEWNKERRRWEFALTEYNLVYLKTWGESHQFEIDAETLRLNNIINDSERAGFAIELDYVDGELTIRNASASLIGYVRDHCGGFGHDNLARLLDLAPILGYTVNQEIADTWLYCNGSAVNMFTSCREIKVDTSRYDTREVLSSVVKYAQRTNRYPVVIFEPDLKEDMLRHIQELVGESEVFLKKRGKNTTLPTDVKYIHTSTPIKDISIPLLISGAGMMFGGDKSLMTQNTEKAIYFAAEVYTNKKEHKVSEFES
jgi:hypothetical protein